ncbi:hypothetical protein V2J09_015982 [Rumex salicifolius]
MEHCKSVNTPTEYNMKLSKCDPGDKVDPILFNSLVGSLMYLTCTRPDILYDVGFVSRYMETSSTTHFLVAKRILRHLKGTNELGLLYSTTEESFQLHSRMC